MSWLLCGLRRNVSGMLDSDRLIDKVFYVLRIFSNVKYFSHFGYQSYVDFEKSSI